VRDGQTSPNKPQLVFQASHRTSTAVAVSGGQGPAEMPGAG
jgi:hypothetical protein